MTWLGIAGAGLLVATLAGTAAASYAVSGVDPFYFSGIGLRTLRVMPDRSMEADVTPQPTTTSPSMPGDQYYYYRPPVATASYNAAPIKPDPAVDVLETARSPDRDATDESKSDPQILEDRTTQPISGVSPSNDEQTTEANASVGQDSLGSGQEVR